MLKASVKLGLCSFIFLLFSCSNDSDYMNIEHQESKVLTRTKSWLTLEYHIQENDLNWSSAVVYQKDLAESYTALIPVRTVNDFNLQRIIVEINPYNITAKLWDFKFRESQPINELQKLPTHKIMENFTGDLKILNLESGEVKKTLYIAGHTDNMFLTSKASGMGVCDNCHGIAGAINLDPVVVTGPAGDPWPNPVTISKAPILVSSGGADSISSSGLTMPPPPDNAINNIKKFLECFSISNSANLTIYAERMGGGNGVGHAFIGISQGNNSAVYGYYPKTSLGSLSGQGIMGENGGHHYDVSASMTITGAQLNQIIALSQVYQSNWYDLSFNNCSDFATDVLNIAGVSTSGWIDTPNTVANILSGLVNHTTGSNNAPKSNKSCQ
ncbi:hypothetical protein [Flavobacterium sp. N502540]|uniref:hypothetical protein n=1 Tax=Flavobacterium sp. N502540 TaxID=2986838 RepID=UPI00222492A9|nr:hypothetical protein [Flavobacterium sp. N502540]